MMIPLKKFFEAVEERLSDCSADELRSVLRAMAQAVAPSDRQDFLERLIPSGSSDNPQGLVVPAGLMLLSGKPTVPPVNVARLWDWALESSKFLSSYEKIQEDQARLKSVCQEVLSRVWLKKAEAESLLSWCAEVGEKRACAIVEKVRRQSYDKAAVITAACAEVLRLRGQPEPADALLERMRTKFPRHRAFQAELKLAAAKVGRGSC